MIDYRAFVRRGLRSVGLSKIHHLSIADLRVRERIGTVFDVGANAGHYGIDLREHGYRGRLVSFEPIASVFRELEANSRRDTAWDCYRIGLGDRDQAMEISVAQASVFSSLKSPSDYTAGKFVSAAEQPARNDRGPAPRHLSGGASRLTRSAIPENRYAGLRTGSARRGG